ncbi:fibronectin type III domain-containing protein [bacterium]|nr:fibronectin type III domain-containing protein [bacterium]
MKKLNPGLIIVLTLIFFAPALVMSQASNCDFWGTATYEGANVGSGDVIKAYDSQGIECGTAYYVSGGNYGIHVAGDDPTTTGTDEGATEGETITFKINGKTAGVTGGSAVWHNNGSIQCNLNVAAPPPSAPSGLSASTISSSQINISWSDNSSNETGFKIERKTGAGGTWSQITTVGANETSYNNTGLSAGVTYYYRVRAYNGSGDSGYSNEANATTYAAPAAPGGLSATAVSTSQINLNWNDNSSNEDGFKIERKTGAGGTWSQIATVGSNATSYNNTGLASGTTYYYRVKAYNGIGDSGFSNEANATTGELPTAAPSGLSASASSPYQVNLSWSDNSSNESGFKIERKTGASGSWGEIATVGANSTSYSNTGLSPSTQYYYRIRAYNTWGNSGYSNETNATTYASVNAPSSLGAAAVSSSQINLSWTDNASNEDGFKIQEKKWAGGTWSQVADLGANTTSYNRTGLDQSTTYYYRVQAYNSYTASGYSNEANATTQGPPAAPSNLGATAVSITQIDLSWQDNAVNEDGFKVERKIGDSGSWTEIASVSANSNAYNDTGLSPGTKCYYRVYAYNSFGNSGNSNETSATSGSIPVPPENLSCIVMGVDQINLAWEDKSENEEGFIIERMLSGGGTWAQIKTTGINVTAYQDYNLTANTAYSYRIKAFNQWGESAFAPEASATTGAISPPRLINCYPPCGAQEIPVSSSIQFIVKQQGFGIDVSKMNVWVKDSRVLANGVDQTGGHILLCSCSRGVQVLYNPPEPFEINDTVSVTVQCQDTAVPANQSDSTYAFQTGETMSNAMASVEIGPEGGVVTDPFIGVSVSIPAGSLSDTTTIQIEVVTNPPNLPAPYIFYGIPYHFSPAGLQFNEPVRIGVPYSQSQLNNLAIDDPGDLIIYYYSTAQDQWTQLNIVEVDEINCYIYVEVSEFCYLVFAASTEKNYVEDPEKPNGPDSFELHQNYPNPFNPETHISFTLPKQDYITLHVFDVHGRLVRTLLSQTMEAGNHVTTWNGKNDAGDHVPSGTYLYQLEAGKYQQVRRMVYVR